MNPSSEAVSPLRQPMIDDMRMHKLELKTRTAYLRAVKKLADFLKRSPDTATVEDLRRFQLYLVDQGTSPITINATISGLKFFFGITLGQSELMHKMQTVRVPQKLPVVLSRDDVTRLIAAAPNLKSQTALSVAYATGLRVSEVVGLKVTDIDSKRMTLRVEAGQGKQGSLRHAPTLVAGSTACLVEAGQRAGQDAARRLAVPGHEPDEPRRGRATTLSSSFVCGQNPSMRAS